MYKSEGVGSLGWVVYGKVIGNKWEILDHGLEFGRNLGGGGVAWDCFVLSTIGRVQRKSFFSLPFGQAEASIY